MFHPRNTSFRTSRRVDPGRYPTRRYVRRLPDLGKTEPELRTTQARSSAEQPWQQPKQLPVLMGIPHPLPVPIERPDQGIGRIIVISIVIMTVVILWAIWGVASLNDWFG